MIHRQTSSKTFEQIDAALRESAARHKFGVVAVHDLRQTMRNKGVDFGPAVMVYEVCNPQQAKKVLESDGAISSALPCRISVYESAEGTQLATILPTAMLGMFGRPDLEAVAGEVEEVVLAMMRDAS